MSKTTYSNRKQKNKTRKNKKLKGGTSHTSNNNKEPYTFNNNEELKDAVHEYCNSTTKEHAIGLYGNIITWNVSAITDMTDLFMDSDDFNEDISGWDVSNVTNMSHMFYGCTTFNQPLNSWNVSNVTSMYGMFRNCKNFNQPLGQVDDKPGWNVSKVQEMLSMFCGCKNFNQPLNSWDVSKVTCMGWMFAGCEKFNQPLNNWNIYNVAQMEEMFKGATDFLKASNEVLAEKLFLIINNDDIFGNRKRYTEVKKIQLKNVSTAISELSIKKNTPDDIKPNIFKFFYPKHVTKYTNSISKITPADIRKTADKIRKEREAL